MFVLKENHCLQDVCHDMTERTLLNFIFTEKISLLSSFDGCNVCNAQYTFKRLNKIHRTVNIGSGFALTMKHTS